MNNQQPSPLMPQGIPLDPKNRGRARVKIAVLVVLAVHGIGLMALLMQGCRREETPPVTETETAETNTSLVAPTMDDASFAPPVDTNFVAPVATNVREEPMGLPPETNLTTNIDPFQSVPPAPAPVAGTSYKVAKGDSFYTIAKKFNVTSRAIADANPNVNPNRLQIGQTLIIPPPAPAAAPQAGTVAPAAAGSGTVYTVKSGDNLTKIANQFGVTVKAIRSENNLPTDRITVGQKLRIPAGGSR